MPIVVKYEDPNILTNAAVGVGQFSAARQLNAEGLNNAQFADSQAYRAAQMQQQDRQFGAQQQLAYRQLDSQEARQADALASADQRAAIAADAALQRENLEGQYGMDRAHLAANTSMERTGLLEQGRDNRLDVRERGQDIRLSTKLANGTARQEDAQEFRAWLTERGYEQKDATLAKVQEYDAEKQLRALGQQLEMQGNTFRHQDQVQGRSQAFTADQARQRYEQGLQKSQQSQAYQGDEKGLKAAVQQAQVRVNLAQRAHAGGEITRKQFAGEQTALNEAFENLKSFYQQRQAGPASGAPMAPAMPPMTQPMQGAGMPPTQPTGPGALRPATPDNARALLAMAGNDPARAVQMAAGLGIDPRSVAAMIGGPAATQPGGAGQLATPDTIRSLLQEAGGDPRRARQIAAERGIVIPP